MTFFTEALSNKEITEIVTRLILDRALGIKVKNLQKLVNGIDTDRHGIRMNVSITETSDKEETSGIIRIYDIKPNNIETINLPKISRYYQT